jgi:transcriptional regulator with XRE-family HTH domain
MKKDQLAAGVGMRIRQVRKEKLNNMNQGEVARKIGLSHGAISHWERGGNAKTANLRAFADFAGVSMEFLLNGEIARAVDEVFHPRWAEIERRLVVMPKADQDAILDDFDRTLNMRDQWIKGRQRKAKKGR